MRPVSTGFPLCSSQLYIAVGVSAACLSVRSSGAGQRKTCVLVKVSRAMLLTLLRQMGLFNAVRSRLMCRNQKVHVKHMSCTETTNLMAAITLIRLLSAVHPLVSVQVVALNEAHVTRVASKWLFSCEQRQVEHLSGITAYFAGCKILLKCVI